MKYIVQYKCGCSIGPLPKKEILEYCGKHGDNIQCKYPVPEKLTNKKKEEIKI